MSHWAIHVYPRLINISRSYWNALQITAIHNAAPRQKRAHLGHTALDQPVKRSIFFSNIIKYIYMRKDQAVLSPVWHNNDQVTCASFRTIPQTREIKDNSHDYVYDYIYILIEVHARMTSYALAQASLCSILLTVLTWYIVNLLGYMNIMDHDCSGTANSYA